MRNIKITGSGCSIPQHIQPNAKFLGNTFYDAEGAPITNPNDEIIEKFKAITGIEQRRYIDDTQTVADIAIEAAQRAIADAQLDAETLDYIIVAHNVGDIVSNDDIIKCFCIQLRICDGTLSCFNGNIGNGLRIVNITALFNARNGFKLFNYLIVGICNWRSFCIVKRIAQKFRIGLNVLWDATAATGNLNVPHASNKSTFLCS